MNFLLAGLLLISLAASIGMVVYGLNKGLVDWTNDRRAKKNSKKNDA